MAQPTKKTLSGLFIVVLLLFLIVGLVRGSLDFFTKTLTQTRSSQPASVMSPFIYTFNVAGTLDETSSMQASPSRFWWMNSGGQLLIYGDGTGSTLLGSTPSGNKWGTAYAASNSLDTDGGTHPQNIFRLVSRSLWDNYQEQAQFYIVNDNFSKSPNRNQSNGLLLFNRYRDNGQTLYYAGVRVDGTAVIKKKYQGVYYTMAQSKVFPGTYLGTQDDQNLIPHEEWISLKDEASTTPDGSVHLTLFMKRQGAAEWTQLLEATDRGQFGGTPPIVGPGYVGIRTDFMDVKFRYFRLDTL